MKNSNEEIKKEKRGMYIALGICLVAVTLAGIGTYSGIQNFVSSVEDSTISVDNDDVEVDPEPYAENDGDQDVSQDLVDDVTEEIAEDITEEEPEIVSNDEVISAQESDDDISGVTTQDEEPVYTETSKDTYKLSDSFMYPVSGNIVQEYSGDNLVYNSTMGDYRVHSGIDISASVGDSVYACNAGEVIACYYDLLLGYVVVIEHGEYEFWYCGLSETLLVEEGDIVNDGDVIGTVDVVPSETETTHIHLQISKNGEFINPDEVNFVTN